ncbi:MAG: alanine--tRNA ligase-related protein, partial [bacterium]
MAVMQALTAKQLIQKYLTFFKERGHAVIPSAPLVPHDDPSTLFISAGMHPLVPYLLGEPHPQGKRLTNVQKCLRTVDIENVGDTTHHTFLLMLGNWSLGDYFKKESIALSWEFLTSKLGIDPKVINVTVFKGDKNSPFDEESQITWLGVGVPKTRIFPLDKKQNWWDAG